MPFARLTLIPAPPPAVAERLAAALTALIAGGLAKRHELTSVLVEAASAAHWTVGAEGRRVAAHLEVAVTAGTNSAAQKAGFLAEATAELRRALPGLDPATYVVIREIAATDWGYDGQSQAARAAAGA